MAHPTDPSPLDAEAARGNDLPDPVLAPRALAELRNAFGPSLAVSEEADARVLHTLNSHRQRKAHRAGFWHGFQIAAVLALAASFILYMNQRRENFAANSPFANAASKQAAEKKQADRVLAQAPAGQPAENQLSKNNALESASAESPAAAATTAMLASGSSPTILDVLKLARKAENSPRAKSKPGFKPSGSVVSPFEEVNQLAAQVVGCQPEQVPALTGRVDNARVEPFADAPRALPAAPSADTRILTFDIMLDVGTRSLAAFQIEVSMSAPDTARVTLMGVRGGDHPALQRQPLFDSSRVTKPGASTTFTIANFDTGKDLPTGDVRVARLVLVVVGPGHPGLTARLVIAAGAEGVPIPAGLRVVENAPITSAELKQKQLEKAIEEAESLPAPK